MAALKKNINWLKAVLIAVVAIICIILGYFGFVAIRNAYVHYAIEASAYGETYDKLKDCVENGLPQSEDGSTSTDFGSITVYDPYNALGESEEASENETEAESEAETEEETRFLAGTYTTTNLDSIGFYYKDVNKDGTKDFLVGIQDEDNNYTRICEIYTLDQDGKVKHVFSATENSYLLLNKDGNFLGTVSEEYQVKETEAEESGETETAQTIETDKEGNAVDQTLEDGYIEDGVYHRFDEETESESSKKEESESAKKETESESAADKTESESAAGETESESANTTETESAEAESTESGIYYGWNITAEGLEEVEIGSSIKIRELHLYTFA